MEWTEETDLSKSVSSVHSISYLQFEVKVRFPSFHFRCFKCSHYLICSHTLLAPLVNSSLISFIWLLTTRILSPFITREVAVHLLSHQPRNVSVPKSSFTFLYAAAPTAPPVYLFASKFDIIPEVVSILSLTSFRSLFCWHDLWEIFSGFFIPHLSTHIYWIIVKLQAQSMS